jgi:hypothetical protein
MELRINIGDVYIDIKYLIGLELFKLSQYLVQFSLKH